MALCAAVGIFSSLFFTAVILFNGLSLFSIYPSHLSIHPVDSLTKKVFSSLSFGLWLVFFSDVGGREVMAGHLSSPTWTTSQTRDCSHISQRKEPWRPLQWTILFDTPYFLQPCKRHAVTGSRSYTHWPRKVWLINLMENLTQWVDKHPTDTWHAHYNTFIRLSSTFRLDAVASICIQITQRCTSIFWGVRASKSSCVHRWYTNPSNKDLSKKEMSKIHT